MAFAGPAVPEAALPVFVDPIERLGGGRAAASAADGANTEATPSDGTPSPDAAGVPVTIIGAPGVSPSGTLRQEAPVDPLAAGMNRFLGAPQANAQPAPAAVEDGALGESVSLAAIARGLLNTIPTGGGSGGGGGAAGGDGGDRGTAQSFFGEALADLVIDLLSPELTAEGFVTFSIAGFGSFALLLSEETGSVFLVDLERGTAIKVFEHERTNTLQNISRTGTGTAGAATAHGTSGAFQRVLRFLERKVYPLLTSPITLTALALFAIVWLVWRISARAA